MEGRKAQGTSGTGAYAQVLKPCVYVTENRLVDRNDQDCGTQKYVTASARRSYASKGSPFTGYYGP